MTDPLNEMLTGKNTPLGRKSVAYWDANAGWYDLWVGHNPYHDRIIRLLQGRVRKDWRVLDIGAGGGVLSLPVAAKGCYVCSLEPSAAMRRFFEKGTPGANPSGLTLDARRFEDVPARDLEGYDLVVACNSLHVMEIKAEDALGRILQGKPGNLVLATELPLPHTLWGRMGREYLLSFSEIVDVESSWTYHSRSEALEHEGFGRGTEFTAQQKKSFLSGLTFSRGHYKRFERATLRIYWFTRRIDE